MDPERSDYRTLRVERGTCFNPLQALSTSPHQTECTSSFLHLRPIQAEIKTCIALFEKCKRIYGLKMKKSAFKQAGTLLLTGIRRIDGELLCVRDAGADAADGGYLWRSMWILWMTSSLSSHSTSASVSELSHSNTYSCILAKMQ